MRGQSGEGEPHGKRAEGEPKGEGLRREEISSLPHGRSARLICSLPNAGSARLICSLLNERSARLICSLPHGRSAGLICSLPFRGGQSLAQRGEGEVVAMLRRARRSMHAEGPNP